MLTRRQLVKAGLCTGAASLVPPAILISRAQAAVLDPASIPKYVSPLLVPAAMPPSRVLAGRDEYQIAARRVSQQILPAGLPPTSVFAFGSLTSAGTFQTPARTIEARANRQTRVTWSNQLMTAAGDFLPHPIAIDPTLHWANPPGGMAGRDSHPTFTSTPGPYRGPIPLVVHLHGSHVFDDSDGYPEAWYLPAARNIPAGYATVGTEYERFRALALSRFGAAWSPGNAIFQYGNDQRATALWYHSHELGMTRQNVYAGLAGMYLIRGGPADLPPGVLPGPAPRVGEPAGTRHYEIPLVLQDKSFNTDGSLSYPASRSEFGDTGGPFVPDSDVPPIWNPVVFSSAIVVNGRTWPFLQVEPRRYRFRLLNASGVRSYTLKVVADPLAARPASPALPIWAIGTDGGFLPTPVSLSAVPIGPAERFDLIVDFSGLAAGTRLYLSNEAEPLDPATTGQVLEFRVVPLAGPDTSVPPAQLRLPGLVPVGPSTVTRRVSMNAGLSAFQSGVQISDLLGTVNADGTGNPLDWEAAVTEHPALNATETWELHNLSVVPHMIHLHLVEFQAVNRQPIGGAAVPPDSWETGFKDTIVAPPAQITRIRARFDRAGLYNWHCHIIDHEDNSMMRPMPIG